MYNISVFSLVGDMYNIRVCDMYNIYKIYLICVIRCVIWMIKMCNMYNISVLSLVCDMHNIRVCDMYDIR